MKNVFVIICILFVGLSVTEVIVDKIIVPKGDDEVIVPDESDESIEDSENETFPLPGAVTVRVAQGVVEGYLADDGRYYAFYNIPYAGPTSGENRFKAPSPASNFSKVFKANDTDTRCAQFGPNGFIGVEDCLTISVFSDNLFHNATNLKPVVVWLPGEEYATSNPLKFSFKNFIDYNFIAVTLNYRLSVFGFLCLGIEEAPGNAGLKDVVQGLKWIRDNIIGFGGDPNNVILLGHGSGAAMVDLITLSPSANGLIHKAIIHSGSAMAPWAVAYDPIGSANFIVKKVGFLDRGNSQLVARHLKNIPMQVLIKAVARTEDNTNNTFLFAPCVEAAELNPNDTFLDKAPIELIQSGEFLHIPVIYGYTDREGLLRLEQAIDDQWLIKMQNYFDTFLPANLDLIDLELEQKSLLSRTIRQFYFENFFINCHMIDEYLDYHGDTEIIIPIIRSAILRAKTSRADIRILEFTYRSMNNTTFEFGDINITGVPHGGILNYVFGMHLIDYDINVKDSLMKKYSKFAYTGSPICEGGIDWRALSRTGRYYVNIEGGQQESDGWLATWHLERDPHYTNYKFWEDLYEHHYRIPQEVAVNVPSAAFQNLQSILVLLLSQIPIMAIFIFTSDSFLSFVH